MQPKNTHPQPHTQAKITEFLSGNRFNKPQSSPQKEPTKQPKEENKEDSPRSRRSHSPTHSLPSSISALSLSPSIAQKPQEKPEDKTQLNVEFYLNKIASRPNGQFLSRMQEEWREDYDRLQRDHSFIQWLFPNSFQSRFNSHARPLSASEAAVFRGNEQMLQRYVNSYVMMLGFYGMKLKNKATGELARSRHPDFRERFHKTLLTSFHNHMRITRMLCSLSELGFSSYATHLCRFLYAEIHSPGGALAPLARYNVYQQWKPFERTAEDKNITNVYMDKITQKARLPAREPREARESKENTKQEKPKEEHGNKPSEP